MAAVFHGLGYYRTTTNCYVVCVCMDTMISDDRQSRHVAAAVVAAVAVAVAVAVAAAADVADAAAAGVAAAVDAAAAAVLAERAIVASPYHFVMGERRD